MSAPNPHPVLACRDLSARYGRTPALDRVSFEVPRGSVYALLGRNGAGKSTLVRCLLGQLRPESGGAEVLGLDPWRRRAELMARVGVVPEDPDLPPLMSADEAAAFCARLHPRWDAAGVAARLDRAGVPRDRPTGKLSRGQRTQVALALALGGRPELLVLDDPTLGLDAVARRSFYQELLEELSARETTVLVTTHDLHGIEGIADRVGMLRRGRLVVDEDMEAMKTRFRRIHWGPEGAPEPRELDPLRPLALRRDPWGGEALVEGFDPAAFEALAQRRPGLAADALSLEEAFVAVMGTESEEVA